MEYLENDTRENEQLTCPVCEKDFQDRRGLTSHARHMHEIGKNDLEEIVESERVQEKSDNFWGVMGGVGITLLALITLRKI